MFEQQLKKTLNFAGFLILLSCGLLSCMQKPDREAVSLGGNTDPSCATKLPQSATNVSVVHDCGKSLLRWVQRHQNSDGSWDPTTYEQNCTGTPCGLGKKNDGTQEFTTALALNLFNDAGYDHVNISRYRTTIRKGILWLVSKQKPDGSWGSNDLNAVCTLMLTNAYDMTSDQELKTPVQKAVDFLCSQQNCGANGSLGWDYHSPSVWNDSYVTTWVIFALASAKRANLRVGDSLTGAKTWLETAWKAANPQWVSLDPRKDCTSFPLRWQSDSATVAEMSLYPRGSSCSPLGGMCAVCLGYDFEERMWICMKNGMLQDSDAILSNPLLMYFATIAMGLRGGKQWKGWNNRVRETLSRTQQTEENCKFGSWDPLAQRFPRCEAGRLLTTIYSGLTLSLTYRFDLIPEKGIHPPHSATESLR